MRLTALIAALGVTIYAPVAHSDDQAQEQPQQHHMACSQRDDVLAQLGNKYKEAPSAVGLANNGGLIEVLTSKDGATWTIIISMPNGTSCLLAAGENWQPVETQPTGPSI